MRNMFKLLFLMLFLVFTCPLYSVNAETISDLRRKLAEIEKKEKENSDNIKKTESEIVQTKAEINQIYTDMNNITNEIAQKEEEIIELGKKIEQKDAETKELMKALQITTGDSFYLEYVFGAESMEDFIYRYSITEQLTKHNSDLIKEMNNNIELNKQRKTELANKQIELTNKQDLLAKQLKSLGKTKDRLYETERSITDEIKNSKAVIQMYIAAGCKETDDINVCANKLLPPDTMFYRPLFTGYATSEFGPRINPIDGKAQIHEAIDISNQYGLNSQVYAVANGLVAKIFYDQWGGNQLVLHHNIGGKKYSSSYAHLSKILVKEGQTVTRDTVVAMMGSTGSSTGPHVHLAISSGLRYKDYVYYSDYVARCVNPRTIINFPKGSGRWYDRITKY